MRISWLALTAFSCTTAPVMAEPAAAPSRIFEGRDLFGLQWATDPQVSPDGRTVAYVRNSYEVMTDQARRSIWLVDIATGTRSPGLDFVWREVRQLYSSRVSRQ